MRSLAIVVVAMLAVASGARADTLRTVPFGFDHNAHDRDVVVSGAESLACERCHAVKAGALAGKPGHAACFGKCHGAAPITVPRNQALVVADDRMKICMTCHSEASLRAPPATRKLAVAYPPYDLGQEFALAIGHKAHAAIACTQCHVDRFALDCLPGPDGCAARGRKGAPHARCAGCHDGAKAPGKGPSMMACKGCHTPAGGKPEPVSMLLTGATQIFVTGAFSHGKHAGRSAAGRQCTTCHVGITATDDRQLPRVVADSCATGSCHDGKVAFPITAACTKCHKTAPTTSFDVERPAQRYSHAAHAAHLPRLQGILACTSCHSLAKNGEVIISGHAPCATCHAKDFGERRPKICGACHNATEPWRPLVADRLPPDRSEFGASLDHGKHSKTCTSCHSLTTSSAQLRPPRGHRACSGSGCHVVSGGPAPSFASCEGCHQRGLSETRVTTRLAAPWSTRATFDHATHELGKDGPIACATCHDDLGSPTVLGLAAPAKATCAPCHDGQTSFKLTGTTCTRCHLGAKR